MIAPPGHPIYQAANACLFLSYLSRNILVLRSLLTIAAFLFFLWGLLILDNSIDTMAWNGIFFLINAYQTILLLIQLFPKKFSPHLENIYLHYFGTDRHRLSRSEFGLLMESLDTPEPRKLPPNYLFAPYKSLSTHLSILLEGQMKVFVVDENKTNKDQNDNTNNNNSNNDEEDNSNDNGEIERHTVFPMEFIDSPEYVGRNLGHGPKFSVSIRTVTECSIIQFDIEKLEKILSSNPGIRAQLDAVLCVDVTSKLFLGDPAFLLKFHSHYAKTQNKATSTSTTPAHKNKSNNQNELQNSNPANSIEMATGRVGGVQADYHTDEQTKSTKLISSDHNFSDHDERN